MSEKEQEGESQKQKKKKKTGCTYIGGQAVIQGVMMRSKTGMATAVRDDAGVMHLEAKRITPPEQRKKITRVPFIRGVVNFFLSLKDGMQALFRSSEVAIAADEDEAPTKLSKWVADKWKVSITDIVTVIATILGVVIAVGLFVFLPNYLAGLLSDAFPLQIGDTGGLYYNLLEGGFRLVIFILYILFTLIFPSLRETYRYHGAEHKTINCFEYGEELTVENVKKQSRMHDRCGTTFIFIVLIVSILIFALVGWLWVGVGHITTGIGWLDKMILIVLKIACLPLVAGVSYEILKLLARTSSPVFLPLKAPGYLLQKLTTREPDDGMIECAIAAFQKAYDMDVNPDSPEVSFATETKLSKLLAMMKKGCEEKEIDGADAEWICSLVLNVPRSELKQERIVKQTDCKKILDIFGERLTGRPLWYIFGETEFYGSYKFKVDERVLIPRPETEILVRQAVTSLKEGDFLLDLCTGSGAVAISVACEAAKDKNVTVIGTDISEEVLEVARANARINKANVTFLKSDLFESVRGKFNIITANPPYVPSGEMDTLQREVREFEPKIALDGGEDGLDFYRRIAEKAGRYIARGGLVILECGEDQAQKIIQIFKKVSRCEYAMVVKDFQGIERVVKIGY